MSLEALKLAFQQTLQQVATNCHVCSKYCYLDGRDRYNQPVFVRGGDQPAPSQTAFAPIAPNPFKHAATLVFTLAAEGRAELAIYSVDGRKVKTLASGPRPAGSYRLAWDGTDDGGRRVSPGLFFARLITPQGRLNRTLVMLR